MLNLFYGCQRLKPIVITRCGSAAHKQKFLIDSRYKQVCRVFRHPHACDNIQPDALYQSIRLYVVTSMRVSEDFAGLLAPTDSENW